MRLPFFKVPLVQHATIRLCSDTAAFDLVILKVPRVRAAVAQGQLAGPCMEAPVVVQLAVYSDDLFILMASRRTTGGALLMMLF